MNGPHGGMNGPHGGMNGLRSGQVARAAGLNQQTLRYYERRGLLAEPDRTPGGHRIYPAGTVAVLRVIKAAQRLGFSLEEVADLLETGRRQRRGQSDAGLRQQAAAKLAEVEAKIADLSTTADTLRAALDAGCSDLMDCAGQPHCPLPFAGIAETPSGHAGAIR
jgi:MerR family transcriptional regulator, mercuric resistance operon regulatory protein